MLTHGPLRPASSCRLIAPVISVCIRRLATTVARITPPCLFRCLHVRVCFCTNFSGSDEVLAYVISCICVLTDLQQHALLYCPVFVHVNDCAYVILSTCLDYLSFSRYSHLLSLRYTNVFRPVMQIQSATSPDDIRVSFRAWSLMSVPLPCMVSTTNLIMTNPW